jgi:acetyltransferase-like isoleucine patch superfamily enzyme
MSKHTFFQRATGFIQYCYHYVRYSFVFYSFGWRSVLIKPDLLTNTKLISIGKRVEIFKGARLETFGPSDCQKPKIVIGDGTSIQMYFHCGAAESVTIGKNVSIAGRVYITDHDHAFEHPTFLAVKAGLRVLPVVIEDEVWLGEGCAVLKGVTIGKRAVVGANAVVTKDVPAFTVVGGIPAKVIKKINIPQTKDG